MSNLIEINKLIPYSMMLPLIPLCFFPALGHIRSSQPRLLMRIIAAVSIATVCIIITYTVFPHTNSNLLFVLIAVFFFILYCHEIDLPLNKKTFLFLSTCLIGAISLLIATIADFTMHPDSNSGNFSSAALLIQLAVIVFADFILYIPMTRHFVWIINNYNDKNSWNLVWIIPGMITAMCSYLVPYDYSYMQIGRAAKIFTVFVVLIILFTILVYSLFYFIAHSTVENQRIEREYYITSMQAKEYDALLKNVQETSRIRHDFRHQLIVISELLDKKNYEQLKEYVQTYVDTNSPEIKRYVSSAPLNALLSHYETICDSKNIKSDFAFNLPESLPISDTDLCVIFGNLLENAVYACEDANDSIIKVKAGQTSPNILAISVSNPYRGVIQSKDGKFMSSRHAGYGQGLESVKLIAEKYNGMLEILDEHHIFTAHILLQI